MLKGVSDAPFSFWFDIVESRSYHSILASFQFDVTARGKARLARAGLMETFPAVVRKQEAPLRLYFSGDFSEAPFEKGPFAVSGRQRLASRLYGSEEKGAPGSAFYWRFYIPFINNTFASIVKMEQERVLKSSDFFL